MLEFLMEKILPVFIMILMFFVTIIIITGIPHFINGDAYCKKTLVITSEKENNYDVNNDGKVNSQDLFLMKKYLIEGGQ